MFTLTIAQIISTYLAGVTGLVLLVWVVSGIRKKKALRRAYSEWTRCRLCGMELMNARNMDESGLVCCPRCGVKNEPRRLRVV